MHAHHPQAAVTSISWGGKQYDPDADGVFDLPEESLADLAAHGLVKGKQVAADEPQDISVPIPRWTNAALLAKATELNLELPADIKRPELIQAVTAALRPQA